MTLGPTRQTLAQRLHDQYRETGVPPSISGGDHDQDGDTGGDGDTTTDQDGDADSGGQQGERSGDGGTDSKGSDFKAITSQDDLDRIIRERLGRERKRIAKDVRQEIEDEAARKVAAEQGDYKKLHDDATKRIADLEQQLADRDRADLKRQLARKHNLDEDALEFVSGDDEETIEASVKKLAKLAARREDVDTDSGKRTTQRQSKPPESLLATYTFGKRR